MLAALTPSVTLLLLYLLGVETPTRRTSAAVVLISAGCFISSYGEGHFDLVGVGFRSMGIVSEAVCQFRPPPAATCLAACRLPLTPLTPPAARAAQVRLALTQKLMKSFHLSVLESQYYLAPVGAFFLLLAALPSELPTRCAPAPSSSSPTTRSVPRVGVARRRRVDDDLVVIKLTNSVTPAQHRAQRGVRPLLGHLPPGADDGAAARRVRRLLASFARYLRQEQRR